jgi:hypothetical protein
MYNLYLEGECIHVLHTQHINLKCADNFLVNNACLQCPKEPFVGSFNGLTVYGCSITANRLHSTPHPGLPVQCRNVTITATYIATYTHP